MLTSPVPAVAVLASGQGSNFEALACAAERGSLGGRIVVLVSDRSDAPALERARRRGIEAVVLPVGRYRSRIEDEQPWVDALRARGVELVLLAGFMRRLHETFLSAYPDRIVNLHPSLLPAFPGLAAIERAWTHGVKVTGCTVHLVSAEVDGGPILGQACVEVREDDTLEALTERIHAAEHRLYPEAVRRFLSGGWRREARRVVFAGDARG